MHKVIPAVILSSIVLACYAAPFIESLPPPVGGNVLESNIAAMSREHVLGTDLNGNDILSRLLYGGQISIKVAVAVNLLGLLLGAPLGAIAAWSGGIIDRIAMRTMDMLIAFPALVLALAIAQSRGPGLWNTVLALSVLSVPACARIARTAVQNEKSQLYVVAARLSGSGSCRILFRHIAPAVAPQLITFSLLGIGIVMTLEGALSFLGLGIPSPEPSWGNMIRHGQQTLLTRPSLMLTPAGALFLTIASCNWLGAALRTQYTNKH